jgi:hypothetical protein
VRIEALTLRHGGKPAETTSFQSYYSHVTKGRGIWKWNNALIAYQRHFSLLIGGPPLSIGEVGVQSGGSINMWKGVLGKDTHIFGFDINPKCKKFAEPNVTITIGDQADPIMWQNFFKLHPEGLDILVDDGGHEAHQMLTTLQSGYPHIHPGGFLLVEDIMNPHLLSTFWEPAASFISLEAWHGRVESVHIYPLVLVVRKTNFHPTKQIQFSEKKKAHVANFSAMWTAINSPNIGGTNIILSNPSWGSLFQEHGLNSIFANFIDLHTGTSEDVPKGCSVTADAVCKQTIINNHVQSRVSAVHVYANYAVVETPEKKVEIIADRKGTEWMSYSF